MNRSRSTLVLSLLMILLQSCGVESKRATAPPPPSGSPNDELFKGQRANKQDYSETATINACSESSSNCYALTADLEHHFDAEGVESVLVHLIHFPNGGYLEFGNAKIPGGGTDSKGGEWTFQW